MGQGKGQRNSLIRVSHSIMQQIFKFQDMNFAKSIIMMLVLLKPLNFNILIEVYCYSSVGHEYDIRVTLSVI